MNQILTDEEITLIVRECARGSSINRDGSTSHRIARAIEAAVINKLNSAEPVAWQNKYLPNSFYTHDNLNPQWGLDDMRPLYEHPPAPSAIESQSAEIAKYKALCNQLGEALDWHYGQYADPESLKALEAWKAMK